VLDGQIGINLRRMAAGVEVTRRRSTPKEREATRRIGEREQRAGVIVSPVTLHAILRKRQKQR